MCLNDKQQNQSFLSMMTSKADKNYTDVPFLEGPCIEDRIVNR